MGSEIAAEAGLRKSTYLDRVKRFPAAELILVMARREAGRLLFWDRSRQALAAGLAIACGLALLIPLHRAFGGGGRTPAYLFLFAAAVQAALLLLAARAVWAGTRHDAASGSLEEIVLTGAPPQALLLAKWLGAAAAGALWALMLFPALLLAGAFTGASPGRLGAVLCCWVVTPAVGALAGALAGFSDRSSFAGATPIWAIIQGWFLLRVMGPRLASVGGPVQDLIYWIHQLDPLTMVGAAVGHIREPWLLKLGFLVLVLAAVVAWAAGAERELPEASRPEKKTQPDLLSLRPLRSLAAAGAGAGAAYDRDVLFRFERNQGWRLRISPPGWLLLLAFIFLPAVPAAVLGAESPAVGPILAGVDVLIAGLVAALGMAASLAAEKEQGRWTSLRCAPVEAVEIVSAKWRTVWLETWPVWAVAAARAVILALGGGLSWAAVPVAVLAPPIIAGAAAGVTAALSLEASSLAVAQQRALLWVAAPPAAALTAHFLLPRLPGLEWLSPAHGVTAAMAEGTPVGLLPLAAQALLGAVALAWTVRRLRLGELG